MHTNAVAGSEVCNFIPDFLDAACNFVPERYRQILDLGNAGAIMRIGVTNAGRGNANQNIAWADLRNGNVFIIQRPADLS